MEELLKVIYDFTRTPQSTLGKAIKRVGSHVYCQKSFSGKKCCYSSNLNLQGEKKKKVRRPSSLAGAVALEGVSCGLTGRPLVIHIPEFPTLQHNATHQQR